MHLIYYKEHPAFFLEMGKGFLGRSKEYYDRLRKISKIRFLSKDSNVYELIDKSEFVVTSGGTIGWEAIIRGKQVMSFGDIWYKKSDGVSEINSLEDFQTFFNNYHENIPKSTNIDAYAQSIYDNCFLLEKDFFRDKLDFETLEYKKDIEKISKAFYNYYNKVYKN